MATSMVGLLAFVLFSSLCYRQSGVRMRSVIDTDAISPGQVFFVAACLGGMLGGLVGGAAKHTYGAQYYGFSGAQ